jgi:hypothetical protein
LAFICLLKGVISILKIAYYYKSKVQVEYQKIIYNDKFKFYINSSFWNYDFNMGGDSNWNAIEYVSVDDKDNIIGFMGANIDRDVNKVGSLRLINFKNKCNVTFAKDLYRFLNELFTVHKFIKIEFTVVVGNPIEKMYDKYCLKYGGRIVGTYKDFTKLTDGNLYDTKLYEIFRTEFLKNA